jgi:nucleolar protein 15
MRSYFSQFGTVTRLRLSRNKKTGKSKHYAFIEFSDEEVSKIVAETMNNYLLFGHILKCKVVPRDNIEYVESLFKGANKRYKPVPRAKRARASMEKKKPEEQWAKKLENENRRRKKISTRLKAKGIDYEFEAPEAKKGETVAAAPETPAIEEKPVEEKPVEAAAPAVEAEKPAKPSAKGKKGKKVVEEKPVEEPIVPVAAPAVETPAAEKPAKAAAKGKKGKKAEKPAEEKPMEEKPAKEPAATEKPMAKASAKGQKKAPTKAEKPAPKAKASKKVVSVEETDNVLEAEAEAASASVEKSPAVKKTTVEKAPAVKKTAPKKTKKKAGKA